MNIPNFFSRKKRKALFGFARHQDNAKLSEADSEGF
jgi:hypothetical protein